MKYSHDLSVLDSIVADSKIIGCKRSVCLFHRHCLIVSGTKLLNLIKRISVIIVYRTTHLLLTHLMYSPDTWRLGHVAKVTRAG